MKFFSAFSDVPQVIITSHEKFFSIFAAEIFVIIPPVPTTEPALPAIFSIYLVISKTSVIRLEPVFKPTTFRFCPNFGSFFWKNFFSLPGKTGKIFQKNAQKFGKNQNRRGLK